MEPHAHQDNKLVITLGWIFDKNMFYYLLNNSFLWVKIWVKYTYNVEIYFYKGKAWIYINSHWMIKNCFLMHFIQGID